MSRVIEWEIESGLQNFRFSSAALTKGNFDGWWIWKEILDTLPFLENENSINIYLEKIIPFIALKEINLNPNQTNEM